MNKKISIEYLSRGCLGQLSHEEAVRDSLKYKGLRTRFRTQLKAGPEFKYGTDLSRQKEIHVELKKGNLDSFIKLVAEKFSLNSFEEFTIKVFTRRNK